MIDLRPEHLDLLRSIILAHLPECRALVFGSRAVGNAEIYSDVDVGLVAQQSIDINRLLNLREALSLSDLPMTVDIVDLAAADAQFRAHVLATGEFFLP